MAFADPPEDRMENTGRGQFYQWLAESKYDGAVGLTAKFTVSSDEVDVFVDIMRDHVRLARAADGCVRYDLNPDFERPDVFFVVAVFDSRTALLAHLGSPAHANTRFESEMGSQPKVHMCFYRHDPVEPDAGTAPRRV
eukprot:TRINITY_DN33151_c0_g1_i1.p2 TRINITY_DN33151_c0_g1~~TRINITY_DN33151_c0_g1_i1.p2  ORF type:complete len:138 (+),score=42.64 TRINITY_DN33151_c0_g1_i1:57-470(+)